MQPGRNSRRRKSPETGSADYRARRQEVLRVAAEIFKQKGYSGTSVNDIAQALSVDRATFYYYSGSKTDIYQEIVLKAVEHNVEIAENLERSSLDPLVKLEVFVAELIKCFRDQYPFMQAYWQEDMSRVKATDTQWAHNMTYLSHRFDDIVIAMVADGQKKGVIRADGEARLFAYFIIGALNSVHRWFKPHEGYTAEHTAKVFATSLIDGLKHG